VGLGVKDIALEAFDRSDLVVCIGYGMVEWHPDRWNSGQKKNIIHIDVLPAEVDRNYIPSVELIGNIKSTLKQINSLLTKESKKDPNLFASIRERIMIDLAELNQDLSFPLKPQRVLSDLRAEMNDADILISDVGAHKMWVARQYPTYQSNSCMITNGFCSMGGAIPGAIAAKRLFPNKNIVALCGDGGFMMSIQALVTAVELKQPIVVLVWDDNCYGLIKWKQEISYHTYSHVDLVNPDLAAVSRALGCHADTIHDIKEFIPKLRAAFAEQNKPTVLVIPIDYSENMKLTKRLGEIVSH
jgi:acetolactate synthase-1/2/3 large subunit